MKSFQIYNASAGSGKTNKLVEEYLSLIIKNPNKNTTNEILTISFTNKAAIEIKLRILDQLRYMANLKNEKKNAKASKDIIINNLSKRLKINDESIKNNSYIILKKILHDYNSFKVKTIDSFIP
jgi:ATP-dependent exoDNAse (exonuclease V) beta subunit